jgi:hypothetical protein
MPADRRTALIQLLARIDQQHREAELIASDKSVPHIERRRARAYRDFFRRSATRAEQLLSRIG